MHVAKTLYTKTHTAVESHSAFDFSFSFFLICTSNHIRTMKETRVGAPDTEEKGEGRRRAGGEGVREGGWIAFQ